MPGTNLVPSSEDGTTWIAIASSIAELPSAPEPFAGARVWEITADTTEADHGASVLVSACPPGEYVTFSAWLRVGVVGPGGRSEFGDLPSVNLVALRAEGILGTATIVFDPTAGTIVSQDHVPPPLDLIGTVIYGMHGEVEVWPNGWIRASISVCPGFVDDVTFSVLLATSQDTSFIGIAYDPAPALHACGLQAAPSIAMGSYQQTEGVALLGYTMREPTVSYENMVTSDVMTSSEYTSVAGVEESSLGPVDGTIAYRVLASENNEAQQITWNNPTPVPDASSTYVIGVYIQQADYQFVFIATSATQWQRFDMVGSLTEFGPTGPEVGNSSGNGIVAATLSSVGGGWYRASVVLQPENTWTGEVNIGATSSGSGSLDHTGSSGDVAVTVCGITVERVEPERELSPAGYAATTGVPATNRRVRRAPIIARSASGARPSSASGTHNLVDYSDPANWTASNVTISTGGPDAFGNAASAARITTSGAGDLSRKVTRTAQVIEGRPHTFTVFLKPGTTNHAFVRLGTTDACGAVFLLAGSGRVLVHPTARGYVADIAPAANGFFRCSLSVEQPPASPSLQLGPSAAGAFTLTDVGVYIEGCGAQFAEGVGPRAFVATTGAAVTTRVGRPAAR